MCSDPVVHFIPWSVWSVLELVKILKLRQNIKLPIFFDEILPTLTTPVPFPNSRLRPPGPGVGAEWGAELALYSRKLRRGIEGGEGCGPCHWEASGCQASAGCPPEGGGKIPEQNV